MITELHLENLKSFAGKKEMKLGPITLVYGPNSAGKSSLIQGLALLKQTIPASLQSSDAQPEPIFNGDYVDLGSFMTAVHGHDPARGLGVGLRFKDPTAPKHAGGDPLAQESIYAGVRFALRDPTASTDRDAAAVQDLAILGDEDDLLEFRRCEDGTFELGPGQDVSTFVKLITSRAALHEQQGRVGQRDAKNLNLLAGAVERLLADGARPRFISSGMFPALPEPGFITDNQRLDMLLGLWFEEYLYSRARQVTDVLGSLAYLGPLRSLPSRFQLLPGGATGSVGFTGEHTTAVLASRPELLDEVNDWLKRLKQRYELAVVPLGVNREKMDSDRRIQVGDLVTTLLIDTASDLAVTPRDVGFGISQMLPVVVQLLVNSNATVCIEQPEVHIHPRLQARMAELFVASMRKGNQVIVETHSESLMLRIQAMIAGGKLSPDDVSVLYIKEPAPRDPDDPDAPRGAEHVEIRIDEDGYFMDEWPDGFFTEASDDVFARARLALDDFELGPEDPDEASGES